MANLNKQPAVVAQDRAFSPGVPYTRFEIRYESTEIRTARAKVGS